MKPWQSIFVGFLSGMIAAGAIFILASQPRGVAIQLLPSQTPEPLKIYITGAVSRPGLYDLPPSSRVDQVISLAGGFAENADQSGVNLAALIVDGQKIVVPYMKQDTNQSAPIIAASSPIPANTVISFPININNASANELNALPGIGESKAAAIVKYREQNGAFNLVEDIQKVPGIGSGIFSSLKGLITVK
jgi:competence protein ComEA